MQNRLFPYEIALRLSKVCYKLSVCENCQRQSCKAFTGLTTGAEVIAGSDPALHVKFQIKLTTLERNSPFSISFSS